MFYSNVFDIDVTTLIGNLGCGGHGCSSENVPLIKGTKTVFRPTEFLVKVLTEEDTEEYIPVKQYFYDPPEIELGSIGNPQG